MRLEGYLKASELTTKQRKLLGKPDFIYDFNTNYHAAEFYLKSRVERLQPRSEASVYLISRSTVKNAMKWSEKLIVKYVDPLVIEIQQNSRIIKVYPLNKLEELGANTVEIRDSIEASRQRSLKLETTRNAKLEAEREAAQTKAAQKSERKPICLKNFRASVQDWEKLHDELQKSCRDHLKIIPAVQLNQGDFRLQPLNEWVRDLCDDLLFPLAEKGNYRYKFKSWEALELAVEEFLIALEAELETPDVA